MIFKTTLRGKQTTLRLKNFRAVMIRLLKEKQWNLPYTATINYSNNISSILRYLTQARTSVHRYEAPTASSLTYSFKIITQKLARIVKSPSRTSSTQSTYNQALKRNYRAPKALVRSALPKSISS